MSRPAAWDTTALPALLAVSRNERILSVVPYSSDLLTHSQSTSELQSGQQVRRLFIPPRYRKKRNGLVSEKPKSSQWDFWQQLTYYIRRCTNYQSKFPRQNQKKSEISSGNPWGVPVLVDSFPSIKTYQMEINMTQKNEYSPTRPSGLVSDKCP